MKNFFARQPRLTSTIFLAATLSGSALAAPPSYPITCRGGAGALRLTTGTNNAAFHFTKSAGPASEGLEPGQCAWHDRAVRGSEPACIQQYFVSATAWIFPGKKEESSFSAETGTPWIKDLLSESKYVTFQAYNPHSGACIVITSVGR